jgi:precorrin-8X/cobalt-precorrin-8 methylmutase
VTAIHPIEAESYRILADRVDLSGWGRRERAVVARIIHASADIEYADTVRISTGAVDRAVAALRRGAPVICDANMVRVGIAGGAATCPLDDVPMAPSGSTRAAVAMRRAAAARPDGALFVIGNAPTALFALLDAGVRPAAVIGLPVGFVGAAESKAALWASGLPCITNTGEKGGSAVAAAAVNALIRLAEEPDV